DSRDRMLPWLTETAIGVVQTYGLLALLAVFALEGALIGKLIPTRTLFLAAVVLLGGSVVGYLSVFAVAVVGATIGQCALFGLIRSPYVDEDRLFDRLYLNDRWIETTDGWFERWGLSALLVSNTLPGVRGYLVIPVALSSTPTYRFPAFSIVGTALYVGALVAIGSGAQTVVTTL
ncbi:MAG: DedA family protein, partial [Halobacteriota archaeon]